MFQNNVFQGVQRLLFLLSELKLTKDFILETLKHQSQAWFLELKVKPLDIISTGEHASIIHLTSDSYNTNSGDRHPAIWFFPKSLKLNIRSVINNKYNVGFVSCQKVVPLHAFTTLSIEQSYVTDEKFLITVKINGTTCEQKINLGVKEFKNVKVYTGDRWYPSANAVIKGYIYKSLPNGEFL